MMTTTTVQPPTQKFMFDRTFDPLAPVETGPAKVPTYTQADLDAARQSSFNEGFAQGEQAANKEQTARIAVVVEKIDGMIGKLINEAAQQQQEQQSDIQELTLAITHKLLPDYIARHGLSEIETILMQVLKEMAREPRLVVRVHDQMLDPLQQVLQDLTARAAYAGKVVLLADDKLGPNDCKVEWADGGTERDINVIWHAIDQAIGRGKLPTPGASFAAAPSSAPESPPNPNPPSAAEERSP